MVFLPNSLPFVLVNSVNARQEVVSLHAKTLRLLCDVCRHTELERVRRLFEDEPLVILCLLISVAEILII